MTTDEQGNAAVTQSLELSSASAYTFSGSELITAFNNTQNILNMGSAREITLKAIENISVVSAQTAHSSSSVTDIVESQSNAINDLNSAASMLSSKSAQLTELLEKFKV